MEEIEKVQRVALKVITGAKKGTSHALLFSETGIEKLQVRRNRRKLVQMYKIQTDQCPSTLRELIPETAMTRMGYPSGVDQILLLSRSEHR